MRKSKSASEHEIEPLAGKKEIPQQYSKHVLFILLLNAGICGTFYGWNSIAAVFMHEELRFSKPTSSVIVSIFFFLNYGLALFGGFFADAFFGQFVLLVVGTSIVVVAVLCLLNINLLSVYLPIQVIVPLQLAAVALFVLGNGISKPGLSAFLGDQFLPNESAQRSQWFSWFYMSIQIGAIGFSLGVPFVYQYLDAWWSFALIIAPVLLGFAAFLFPYKSYRRRVPGTNVFSVFFSVIFTGLLKPRDAADRSWLDKAYRYHDRKQVDDVRTALRVLTIFVPLPFFWAVFFQMYNIWVFQAMSMNRTFGTFVLPAAVTTVLNGLLDIGLIPLFEKVIYPLCERCFNFTLLRRIGVGHIFTIGALVAAGIVNRMVVADPGNVSVLWVFPQYFLISCGEILLSISGLEFAYKEAPDSMKGMMTAVFMSTTAIGNGLIVVIALIAVEDWIKDFIFAGIIAAVLGLFMLISYFYEYADHSTIN